MDVNDLARAQLAPKSVFRIILRDAQGREIGYGSGFKRASTVLMANHHVLEDAAQAATVTDCIIRDSVHRSTPSVLASTL